MKFDYGVETQQSMARQHTLNRYRETWQFWLLVVAINAAALGAAWVWGRTRWGDVFLLVPLVYAAWRGQKAYVFYRGLQKLHLSAIKQSEEKAAAGETVESPYACICPACGCDTIPPGRHTSLPFVPQPEDAAVCGRCGHICEYYQEDGKLKLKAIPDDRLQKLAGYATGRQMLQYSKIIKQRDIPWRPDRKSEPAQ